LKKKVNLKFRAHTMRDPMSDEQAYEASALFTHFAPAFQAILTQAMWLQLVEKFKRGGLDHELSEKIAHKDPKITVESFRFLQTFGGQVVQRSGGPVENLDVAECAAVDANESSELKVQKIKLARESAKWKD
jgi:hypothetical protein